MGGGNKDALKLKFIKFVLSYPTKTLYDILETLPDHKRFHVIHNNHDLKEFLETVN